MKKDDIISRLLAAGVTIPAGATVATLTEIAAAHNVDITDPPVEGNAVGAAPDSGIAESAIDLAARKEVEAIKPAALPKGFTEEQILEKTRLGLSREQAITILKTQAEHDAALAAAEKKTGKA